MQPNKTNAGMSVMATMKGYAAFQGPNSKYNIRTYSVAWQRSEALQGAVKFVKLNGFAQKGTRR